jgi:hypothetical protein
MAAYMAAYKKYPRIKKSKKYRKKETGIFGKPISAAPAKGRMAPE